MSSRALGLCVAVPFLLTLVLSPAGAMQEQTVGAVSGERSRGLVALAPPHVRDDFAAGIEALHDFWYEEAMARFRIVQRDAPDFPLGYWGEAFSLHRSPFEFAAPPLDNMRAVLARLAPTRDARAAKATSDHERRYLLALEDLIADAGTPADRHPAYAQAMGELARTYPDDIEALAFHARAILLEAPSFGRSPEVRARTAEAARRVLDVDPNHHGGLHYFIHGMDAPDTASEALNEANRYQRIAAGASHAVHMPSHIYLQLGLWDQVASGNKAAVRTSEEWIRAAGRTRESLDQHAVDFLLYGLLQQGREAEARAILDRAQRDRAEFNTGALRWYEGLWSARYAMELGVRSDVSLPRSGYRSVGEVLGLGVHAVAAGDDAGAREYLAEARAQVDADAGVEWQIAALELEAALSSGEPAVEMARDAIALQVELGRPNETPDLVKPPEELLGEILLREGEPIAAAEAFRAGAKRWPARLATRLGLARAAHAADREADARDAYAEVLLQLRQARPDHPGKVEAVRYLESTGGVPVETRLRIMPGRAPGTLPEVEKRGTGPVPMVIIPCMSCRWASFNTFMERNHARYTMYAVTLPGFGGTPTPELPMYTDHPVWFSNAVDAVEALIDSEDLHEVVLMGHSYGSVVATGVAARRPDRVRRFINVDGNVNSDRDWFEDDPALRPAEAAKVVAEYLPQLADAEYWRSFNGASLDDAARRALYHGMFTATPREVLLQYWRENTLVDLNPLFAQLEIPILDLKTVPANVESLDDYRVDYRGQMVRNGAPSSLHTVFLERTTHFVMEHRPQVLDRMVVEFMAGRIADDFHPAAALGHLGPEDLARGWLSRLRRTLSEDADGEAVDRLLDLYSDDIAYVHPSAGIKLAGRDAIRQHLSASLNTTRTPRVDLQGLVVAGDDAILTFSLQMEVRDGERWVPVRRKQSVILRVAEGQIVEVVDYW